MWLWSRRLLRLGSRRSTNDRLITHSFPSGNDQEGALWVELPRSKLLFRKGQPSAGFSDAVTSALDGPAPKERHVTRCAHTAASLPSRPQVLGSTRIHSGLKVCKDRPNPARCARGSARLSQGFCRYDAGRDGDRDRVRQVYAAQFVACRIQIRFDAGERQIQNPGNVVVSLASRRPDQNSSSLFDSSTGSGASLKLMPAAESIKTAIGCNFTIFRDLYLAQSSFE